MGIINPTDPEGGHTAWDYARAILYRLESIQVAVEDGRGDSPIARRLPFNIQCDASGNGEIEFPIPRGAQWQLTAIAFEGSGNGYIATYANGETGAGLLKVNQSATIVTDTFDDECEITSDDVKVLIVVRGETASQTVSGNLRLKQYDSNPNPPKDTVG